MKILITASPWMGGSGTVGIQLANELAKEHQVFFLSFDFPARGSDKPKNLVFYNFTSFSYALFPYPLYTESLAEKMLDIVKKHEIDVIHAHYSLVFGTSAVLAKQFLKHYNRKVSVVVTMHGTDVVGFDPTKNEHINFENLNSFIVKEADAVTAASSYMRDFIVSNHEGEEKISIIPNFIDTSLYQQASQNSYESRDTLVHISNFRKVKRPMIAAKVFKEISERKSYKGTHFLFVGDGPLKKEVEEYVSQENIPNVFFVGQKSEEDIIRILKDCKAILLPSDFENFPLVLLEALASGVPQIAADVGGMRDVVVDGETGFLIDSNDEIVASMTDKFMELDNFEIWNKMSEASKERSKKFDVSSVVDKYEELYKKTLE
jgi:N-acetyl-alpha-D-glucosaminyl L-malate synthase BshA